MGQQIVKQTAYILRTCRADMTSYDGFVWPKEGHVAAPDWKPTKECGNGLHGFLNGEGHGRLANWSPDAVWIVARIEEHIDLGGKVKFPEAWVEFCGDRKAATDYLMSLGINGAIVGCYKTSGDGSTVTSGDRSTVTSGDRSTVTSGDDSTVTSGYRSTVTSGDRSTVTSGDRSTVTSGYRSTVTSGDGSTVTSGYRSTVTLYYWDGRRRRALTIYPGEDGILPNRPYRCIDGKPVLADEARA